MNQGTTDENLPPNQIPTPENIGRQAKRLKIAQTAVDFEDSPVTERDVGDRTTRLVSMSMERLVNRADDEGIVGAFGAAIHAACQPDGPISTAIQAAIRDACQPGGPIQAAIRDACQPGGAVANLFVVERSISDARYINEN
ncbi:hypothetical protein HK103_003176, partial [Boothiomyces macroporosus]